MWNAPPVIFDNEDEEKLKADFIRLCALYPEQTIFEIASYVFRNQVDPETRSQQAAQIWNKDLEVLERIRLAKLNGGTEPKPIPDKSIRLQQLQEIFESADTSAKDKIAVARLIAEMEGEIVKAVDKNVTNKSKVSLPTFVIAQYSDD